MKRLNRMLLPTMLAFGMASAMAEGPTAGPNLGDGSKDSASGTAAAAVSNLATAQQLARIGQEKNDPLLLAAAAALAADVGARGGIERVEGAAVTGDAKAGDAGESGPAQWLAAAEELASGNASLTAVVQEVKSRSSRGREGGPADHWDAVQAYSTDVYNISFRGRERAVMAVSGDGDTDLDLFVYDENGNEVCRDDDYTDQLYCEWTPRWTGPFSVRIVNLGGVYNRYRLMTN